ncbi:MAG: element excision factor XisI family protein [Chitinophagales bacterium]
MSDIFHLQIKGDKIWVHEDNTDLEIAEVIARAGIPKSKIVLGV